MARLSFYSLRVRLASIILLMMVLISCLVLNGYFQERNLILSHMKEDLRRIVGFMARDQEQMIGRTRQLLTALAELPDVRRSDGSRCGTLLSLLLDEYPRYGNLGVADLNGSIICSAVPSRADFSHTRWFMHAVNSLNFAMGISDSETEFPAELTMGYPVLDEEHKPQAVVFAKIDFSRSEHFFSHIQTPRQVRFMMINQEGKMLNCYPEGRWCSDKSRQDKSPQKDNIVGVILSKGLGTSESRDSDGMDRLYAFSPLSEIVDTGIYVAIGVPLSALYDAAGRILIFQFIGLWSAALILIGLVWFGGNTFIIKPIDAMVETAQQLARGYLDVRTGQAHHKGELGRLSRALDDMAEALGNRRDQVEHHQQQLRSLASQLVNAEERERRRLATDLHDRVGQLLAASKINLGLAQQASRDPESSLLIDRIRDYIEQAIQETRSLTFQLSPPVLYELGLEAALQYLVEQVGEQYGIGINYTNEMETIPLDEDVRVLLYRGASELLTNVVKHASAHQVTLSTRMDGSEVLLSVQDDGIGFKWREQGKKALKDQGFGLFSIRERLSHIGGRLTIDSQPGKGSRICLIVPSNSPPESRSGAK
jgi:signal transduction histidine kinase